MSIHDDAAKRRKGLLLQFHVFILRERGGGEKERGRDRKSESEKERKGQREWEKGKQFVTEDEAALKNKGLGAKRSRYGIAFHRS